MNRLLLLVLLIAGFRASAQHALQGEVVDEKAVPLGFVTVALLHPADSTLAFFAITKTGGEFEVRSIKTGSYILQVALLGYQTIYKPLDIPYPQGKAGTLVLRPRSVSLNEVEVTGERIPILIKKDTIEYDAGSYKTKPDAVTEDLLKKLPGVEVDRAGNIKAQGEDVKNVLVDGKEFFGGDPKVATKNLPADAVKKVQVYDKKSDEAEFTGIDDGSRSKTINLLLKDDKKSAWMGEALVGGGSDSRYQASSKAYRFTKQSQFAALGMLNNINQFGFSFRDYIDFNGGIRSMMNGDGDFRISFSEDDNFPVNFGQPVTGLITSGAGGLNYTYEKKRDNRINISYLGNGMRKKLVEETFTRNFTPGNDFTQSEKTGQDETNYAHRFNFGWRNKPDSSQNILVNGNAGITNGRLSGETYSSSFSGPELLNDATNSFANSGNGFNGSLHASYLSKGYSRVRLFKVAGDVSGKRVLRNSEWNSLVRYFNPNLLSSNSLFQNNAQDALSYALTVSSTIRAGRQFNLVPQIKGGSRMEKLETQQGQETGAEIPDDSVSGDLSVTYNWIQPGLSLRRSNEKSQLNISAFVEAGNLSIADAETDEITKATFYILPRFSWEYEYRQGHRIGVHYESSLNTPDAGQLLPLPNTLNPLERSYGNRGLRPEYIHQGHMNWVLFDQFSFTSLFVGIRGTYTKDKINWSREVDDQLNQVLTLMNVRDDFRAGADIDFSTPIRKLGVNIHVSPSETWNRGINFVNGTENTNTNFVHGLTLSFDNRKKEKWDVSVGGTVQYTTARYSLQEALNNDYFNLTGFTELSYQPDDRWHFSASADLTRYESKSFREKVDIPLIRAAASLYFLKAKRGVLILDAFDLLNKNTGISRSSEMNYLREKQSNVIGRYVMLTFKYRLNRFDDEPGIDVKVNRR